MNDGGMKSRPGTEVSVERASFNKPDEVFSSNPRIIQLGLRFNF